jgi:hypothetical protein
VLGLRFWGDSLARQDKAMKIKNHQSSLRSTQMKKLVAFFVVMLFMALPLMAKPKKKSYNNTPQEVFDATLKTARERHVVTYVNEKNLMVTFETGVSMMATGFVANASIEPEADNKATLIINVQHKDSQHAGFSFNAGDRMADKFYQQVEEELARTSQQKAAGKAEAPHVEVPPLPVAPIKTEDTGKVTVDSTPPGAEVTVDGAFVGNAPSTLKLLAGKHTINVSQAGYKKSSQELMVGSGSELKLNANLSKE